MHFYRLFAFGEVLEICVQRSHRTIFYNKPTTIIMGIYNKEMKDPITIERPNFKDQFFKLYCNLKDEKTKTYNVRSYIVKIK